MKIKLFITITALVGLTIPLLFSSDTIVLSAGLTLEPYIIEPSSKELPHTGIEVEIVQKAFALEGHEVKMITLPFQRSKGSFKKGYVQGVLTTFDGNPLVKGAYFSDVYIIYQNVVVTLASRDYQLHSIDELSRLNSVLGFQQASVSLGREFETYSKSSPSYSELSNQLKQVEMLYRGHIDAAVIDINIFKYLRTKLPAELVKQKVIYHEIFASTPYKIAFRQKRTRDIFNRGLHKLQKKGIDKAIIKKYLKRLPE